MRVIRGRATTVSADRERTRTLLDRTGRTGEPAVRVWAPHRQVAFGRREAAEPGYDRAVAAARERGFEPVERSVGGRAVAYTGHTVAFALAEPTTDGRAGIGDRYDRVSGAVQRAMDSVGVDAREGEPTDSFCPGTHSLRADGKLAGIAQRVRQDVALTAGVVVVRDHAAVGDVLAPVYDALGVPFDPDTVGSVAHAGGDTDGVLDALAAELVGARTVTDSGRIRDT